MRVGRRDAARLLRTGCLMAAMCGAAAVEARAAEVDLRLSATVEEVTVADTFEVSFFADAQVPLLGFGFDISFDDQLLDLTDVSPGSVFRPTSKHSDQYLSGLAYPTPVSGRGMLLGKATFTALAAGKAFINLLIPTGNLNRGFAELTVGEFAEWSLPEDLEINIVMPLVDDEDVIPIVGGGGGGGGGPSVPEPTAAVLLALGSLVALRRRG